MGHSHTVIHVVEYLLENNEAQLGYSVPPFQGLQYGTHKVQCGGSLQVAKLLVISEVSHVCQGEGNHVALQSLPEGVFECRGQQLFQAGDVDHFGLRCHR